MAGIEELEQLGYQDASLIGRGGFGAVYSALDSAFGRRVAIKLIATDLDEEANRRFERERRALAALPPHPHIVTVHAVSRTASGRPFFVMELAEGGSLRAQAGQLPWPEVFAIGVQLAGALETAHQAGVVHRDLKPENVLLGRYGDAKLGDFGIASLAGSGGTATAAVTATLSHAAPEILSGAAAGPATDIYSLASTLHTLVAGNPPFVGGAGGMPQLIAQITSHEAPSLADEGVPRAAADVISRALSKAPADRPASAQEFGMELSEQLRSHGAAVPAMAIAAPVAVVVDDASRAELTESATSIGRRGPAPQPSVPVVASSSSGRRRWAAVAAAVALVLAGTAVAVAQPWHHDSRRAAVALPGVTGTPTRKPGATVTRAPVLPPTGLSVPPTGLSVPPTTAVVVPTTAPLQTGVLQPTVPQPPVAIPPAGVPPGPAPVKVNHSPALQSVSTRTSDELASVTLRLVGRDADGDRLTYSVSGGLPTGVSLNASSGVISGRIRASAASVTTRYTEKKTAATRLVVRVSDGRSTAQQSFTWNIHDTAFVMPNYFNAYGCGNTCSPPSYTDTGKPDINVLGPHPTFCNNTRPSGITDTDKIYSQSVSADSSVAWGTTITYGYYPCR